MNHLINMNKRRIYTTVSVYHYITTRVLKNDTASMSMPSYIEDQQSFRDSSRTLDACKTLDACINTATYQTKNPRYKHTFHWKARLKFQQTPLPFLPKPAKRAFSLRFTGDATGTGRLIGGLYRRGRKLHEGPSGQVRPRPRPRPGRLV